MDRRLFRRIDGSLKVRYSLVSPENSEEFLSDTKNLSGGGLSLFLNKAFKKGDLVRLIISTAYSPIIEMRCFGRVTWIWDDKKDFSDAGIEFINQNLFQAGRLYTYLENQKIIF